VAHRGDHPLLCLNPDGRLLPEVGPAVQRKSNTCDLHGTVPIPMETRHWLHGLHDDPWDNVWVTDVGRHLVMKFDPAGILIATFGHDGEHGCSDRLFYQPTHVCILPTGGFFVADGYGNSRIIKFSATGRRRLEWGTRGPAPGEFHTPHVITLGRDGLLYVSDRGNDRGQVFDSDGSLRAEWSGLHSVDDLHAAPDGRIYGAAGLDNAIVEFDSQGRPAQVWAKPGFFCYPHCLTLDAAGTIYVAEIAGNRGLRLRRSLPARPMSLS
jgi:streptogramin lyase